MEALPSFPAEKQNKWLFIAGHDHRIDIMKSPLHIVYIILSLIGLGLTVIPSFLVFAGVISLYENKELMFAGTVLWFITAPLWIGKKDSRQLTQESES